MVRATMANMDGWCILRTSGGRTLRLAETLNAAGLTAWTPKRTFKRIRPGKQKDLNGRRLTMEIDAPILPTFVFARANCLSAIEAAAVDPSNQHPPFSIFHHAGRVPLVADREVVGLQEEERAAEKVIAALREAEGRDEKRRIRAEAATNERARRQALQAERKFNMGDGVSVDEASAFAGMSGVVLSSRGKSAVVQFGGSLTMTIEAWQLSPALLTTKAA